MSYFKFKLYNDEMKTWKDEIIKQMDKYTRKELHLPMKDLHT